MSTLLFTFFEKFFIFFDFFYFLNSFVFFNFSLFPLFPLFFPLAFLSPSFQPLFFISFCFFWPGFISLQMPRAFLKPRRPRGPDAEVIGGARPEGALRSGTEKRPGTGGQPDKRKEADAAEGQEERSNEAEAETPESTTAGSVWNPAVPPE